MAIKLRQAAESISFQSTEFFDELSGQIDTIRQDKRAVGLTPKAFFKADSVLKLSALIQKHTGMNIDIAEAGLNGPAIYPPQISGNHVFLDKDMVEMLEEYDPEFNSQKHLEEAFKALGKPVIKGEIDLKKGRVSGAFEKMTCLMILPQAMILDSKRYSGEEVASVILHETGHAFTFMEYITRTLTTNQALSHLSKLLDGSVEQSNRVVLFGKAGEELKLDAEKKKALQECKTPEQLSVVLLDAATQKSVSELGGSIYDVNTAEYLADQYATRQGAGRALVTALDKIHVTYGMTRTSGLVGEFIMLAGGLAALTIGVMVLHPVLIFYGGLILSLALIGTNKENEIYDNPMARFRRVRDQFVQQLKDDPSDELRVKLLSELKQIDEVMDSGRYADKLTILSGIAYYLRPGYRAAHKYEMLQKELEQLASSDVFVHAAKLKAL
jgi:hypothetical protein